VTLEVYLLCGTSISHVSCTTCVSRVMDFSVEISDLQGWLYMEHAHHHDFEFILRPGLCRRELRSGEIPHPICKLFPNSIILYIARVYHQDTIHKSQHPSETWNPLDLVTSGLKAYIRALPDSTKSNCNIALEYRRKASHCPTGNPYFPASPLSHV
jgi:hypothetical protein